MHTIFRAFNNKVSKTLLALVSKMQYANIQSCLLSIPLITIVKKLVLSICEDLI